MATKESNNLGQTFELLLSAAPTAASAPPGEISTIFNDLHPRKANRSMLFKDEGIATLANEVQSEKANCSMLVTDAGMATLANELQLTKAY